MKRISAVLPIAAVTVALLAGCGTVSGSKEPDPFDVTDPIVLAAQSCDDVGKATDILASAVDAAPTSPHRAELEEWGFEDPSDDKAVQKVIDALEEFVDADCKVSPDEDATDQDSDDSEDTVNISQAMIDALTITTISKTAECATDSNGLVPYEIGALIDLVKSKDTPNPRLYSDALGTPFLSADDAVAMITELKEWNCKDPLLGVTWLYFFANDVRVELYKLTGVDLVEQNPWLKPYVLKTGETALEKIVSLATKFAPLIDVKDPSDKLVLEAIKQNRLWQADAGRLNTLLEDPVIIGIGTPMSSVTYHLANGGLVVGALPSVEVGPNEDRRAVVLSVTEKDQCESLLDIGANVETKQPELFPRTPCTTTPPTGCTTNCGHTQECPPGQEWNGRMCLEVKLHVNDVTPPGDGAWTVDGNDSLTSGTEGTGAGTSGNVVGNGSSGSGTTTGASGAGTGTTTVTGADSSGANGTGGQQTTVDNPGGVMTTEPK